MTDTELEVDPCIPLDWPGFEATIAWRSARYRVVVSNPGRVCRAVGSIRVDGAAVGVGPVRSLEPGVDRPAGLSRHAREQE